MKKILLLLTLICLSLNAQTYRESASLASDEYIGNFIDMPIVRSMNGGTKFRVYYDLNVPLEMKGAFEYACKIWEEVLPSCLPITVKIECAALRGSNRNALSTVSVRNFSELGLWPKITAPAAQIKYLTLKEFEIGSNHAFYEYIPSVEFLEDSVYTDFKIVYNKNRLNDFSFSLDSNETELYDFVSLALRDIAKGLGFVSAIECENNSIYNTDDYYMPFEQKIWNAIGTTDPNSAYIKATSGQINMSVGSKNVKLYAPNVWQNGISLATFIPDENIKLTQLMRYDFGKGLIYRDLTDPFWDTLLEELLYWKPNYPTGSSGSVSLAEGSTDLVLPFNGEISFSSNSGYALLNSYDAKRVNQTSVQRYSLHNDFVGPAPGIYEYCDKFHPFWIGKSSDRDTDGWSVSILKKDGTWDDVYYIEYDIPEIKISLKDLTFHYNNNEYARTCDGYLRGRITKSYLENGNPRRRIYHANFFVIDYLPQQVALEVNEISDTQTFAKSANATNSREVKVSVKNVEGLTRLVIERLREGRRVPSKIEISDFKKGYFNLTVENDYTNTLTAVAYNANGMTKGSPVVIEKLSSGLSATRLKITSNTLTFEGNNDLAFTQYEIVPLNSFSMMPVSTGIIASDGTINISDILSGEYVLRCSDKNGVLQTYKFIKYN